MRVLVACEYSGTVRDAFLARGHEALSCDLVPSETPGPHHVGDVRDLLDRGWDLMIAHPPCTYLSTCSHRPYDEDRLPELGKALAFFVTLLTTPEIPRVAVENPGRGVIGRLYKRATQMIEPWQYGHPYTKKTGLWLRGLRPLRPTRVVPPHGGLWTDQQIGEGMTRETAARIRARTFSGIAEAMAEQWGSN